ncbi:cytochrome P450 [Pholiota conissans]|uniref:Cytochrome P450 n=1 Tax=Pholiota conissans TaxID=109636 RepID=A0A9P5Z891_9AGAR|nr:cytochrome P450 [Pholiota conissans]
MTCFKRRLGNTKTYLCVSPTTTRFIPFSMQDIPTYTLPTIGVLLVGYAISKWLNSATYQLRHIPTVGPSGPISSYLGAIKYFQHGQDIVREGYEKHYPGLFKVPTMGRWMVVATGPQSVEDIRRASDDQLSFIEALIQSDYTFGPENLRKPFHVAAIRSSLTRNLSVRFEDLKDEIFEAFPSLIPVQKEWVKIPAYRTMMKTVCMTSNRLFVGLPLCRDPGFRELNEQFTIDVIKAAWTINMFPTILKPIIGNILTNVPKSIKRGIQYAGPLIQERLEKEDEYGPDWPERPNDMISWLLQQAQTPEDRNVRSIVLRLLSVNFAAIHTTSMAFTHILYYLAANPQYVAPMREEVESIVASDGWTKVSMAKMRKLDSFIKESQRMNVSAMNLAREALQDFTFSNGITIPAGTQVAVATNPTHMDKINYENPEKFDGFRYAEMREEDGESLKHQSVALTNDYFVFGTGRHACPGRFFAVNELKAMLIHVLLTYDVKMPNDGPRPQDFWFQGNCVPNLTAEVMFRKRV